MSKQIFDSLDLNAENDSGVELILKEQTIDRMLTYFNHIDKGRADEWVVGYEAGVEDAIAVIESMPVVTPQEPRWIPCSEELPKKTGWYLITFKTYDGEYAVSEMCYRKPENYWTDKDISKKVFDNDEVVAWMPLPEPYKENEDGEN